MADKLTLVLQQTYFLLRDEGYSSHLHIIRKLLYCIEVNDVNQFKKEFKSLTLWGGSGSIRDIDLRDQIKQNELREYLKQLKELGSNFGST